MPEDLREGRVGLVFLVDLRLVHLFQVGLVAHLHGGQVFEHVSKRCVLSQLDRLLPNRWAAGKAASR